LTGAGTVPAVTATPGATPDDSKPGKQRGRADQPPAAAGAARRRPEPVTPAVVRYAFIVWVTAGAVGVLNGVQRLLDKRRLTDDLIKANRDPNITNEQVAQYVTTLVYAIAVLSVVFAVLFSLFAHKAQNGARRSRLMLTWVGVVVVLYYFLLETTLLGLLSGLLALAGAVLLYLPKANEYFRAAEPVR
jgi:hypothetical protein